MANIRTNITLRTKSKFHYFQNPNIEFNNTLHYHICKLQIKYTT